MTEGMGIMGGHKGVVGTKIGFQRAQQQNREEESGRRFNHSFPSTITAGTEEQANCLGYSQPDAVVSWTREKAGAGWGNVTSNHPLLVISVSRKEDDLALALFRWGDIPLSEGKRNAD